MRVPSIVAVVTVSACCIVACGGSSSPPPQQTPPQQTPVGACPKPVGAYVLTMDATEGDCAAMPRHREQLMVMGQGEDADCRPLDEHVTPRAEGCVYEFTELCQRSGLKMTANVSVAVPPDTREMRGSLVYQIEAKNGRCLQRYNVHYLKNGP